MPDPSEITVFAKTNFRNMQREFGIKRDDRRRHMYVVGKTGMGKSTLLENMVIDDIRKGRGVALVDPHGDLAEQIINYIPSERTNDVIYFNPADTKFPIAFNILESIGPDYKHLVAYGLVGVFKKIWADSWGPRMEYILTNTILALLDYPGSTLLGVMRMLVDKAYRKKVVAKVTDPVVKTFWSDEFSNYSEKFRTEAIAPIQNKVGQFLSSSIIRNIVGQSKSTIEMRDLMDNEKILIMNLAKGRVGEENSALLGAMMITKLQIAAMSRVDIPEEERKDFYLYVDEFQNFATDSFAGILSEARKYRLNLIMAHQYIEQLGDEVRNAVFGNVGTMLVFRVGAADALVLEPEFGPQFTAQDIVNLDKYTFILRLMIDGIATEPFSAIGMAPYVSDSSNERDKIIRVSRERYGRPQDIVEDRIIRWSGVDMPLQNKPDPAEVIDEHPEDNDFMDDDDYDDSKSATAVKSANQAASSGDDGDDNGGSDDVGSDNAGQGDDTADIVDEKPNVPDDYSNQPDLADRMIPSVGQEMAGAFSDEPALASEDDNVTSFSANDAKSKGQPIVQMQADEVIDEGVLQGPTHIIPDVGSQPMSEQPIPEQPIPEKSAQPDTQDVSFDNIVLSDEDDIEDRALNGNHTTSRVPKINIISSLKQQVNTEPDIAKPPQKISQESTQPAEQSQRPIDAPTSENIDNTTPSDGISLRDLRAGQVETVAFTGSQSEVKSNNKQSESKQMPAQQTGQPKDQTEQPANEHSNDQSSEQSGDQPKKKRKRKRKKKSNADGDLNNTDSSYGASQKNNNYSGEAKSNTQSQQSTNQPSNNSSQSMTKEREKKPEPTPQPTPQPKPQAQPEKTPDDPNDKTKVSLDDIM